MKISHILAAAGLAVASLTISTSASAQDWRGDRWHDDRGWRDRDDDRRGWRDRDHYDRGRHYGYERRYWHGPRWRHARYRGWYDRCWIEWHRGYRVRVCD